MLHTKFRKNWPNNFQEVKNVQLLRHVGQLMMNEDQSGDVSYSGDQNRQCYVQ